MNLRTHLQALLIVAAAALPGAALAGYSFTSIDGGKINLDDFRGQPVLVVNSASLCGFSGQYADLQTLHDRYAARGLVVLAVPSDDFNQELASEAEVKSYCEANFDLTLPMTTITHVIGPQAHPFYQWLDQEAGFAPNWNFNKVLLAPDGSVVATWGSMTNPLSPAMIRPIEALLK